MTAPPSAAVLGLGEAGATLAADLVDAGWDVRGFDPVLRQDPAQVLRAQNERHAARGADLVLSVNAASVALAVAKEVAPVLAAGQVYADMNTVSPALKAELDSAILPTGAVFADVALLGPVPERGIRAPALASGSGAPQFAGLVHPLRRRRSRRLRPRAAGARPNAKRRWAPSRSHVAPTAAASAAHVPRCSDLTGCHGSQNVPEDVDLADQLGEEIVVVF